MTLSYVFASAVSLQAATSEAKAGDTFVPVLRPEDLPKGRLRKLIF